MATIVDFRVHHPPNFAILPTALSEPQTKFRQQLEIVIGDDSPAIIPKITVYPLPLLGEKSSGQAG
jgi:hypothetical protein